MPEEQQPHYESAAGCLIRIYWTLLGPGLLFALAAAGVANRPRLGSAWDFFLAAILLSLVAARLLDRGHAAGDRGLGSGKYAGIVAAIAAAIFGIVHWAVPAAF